MFGFIEKSLSSVANNIQQIVNSATSPVWHIMSPTSHNIIDPTSVSSVVRLPKLPACCSLPAGGLELGTLISVFGTIKSNGRRFRIDFYSGKCEHVHGEGTRATGETTCGIAFHFNPRIGEGPEGQGIVVMNSFFDGKWGQEERRTEGFPFKPGMPFQMMILVENEDFKIAVDGQHLYEFKHRSDFKNIARIHVEGDLDLDLLEFRKELKYLSRSDSTSSSSTDGSSMGDNAVRRRSRAVQGPPVPYLEVDPNLSRPCDIYIAGMLPSYISENFVINLAHKKPSEAIKNIAVHISIRADISTVVRNTMTDGNWGEEELYLEAPFQLIPGAHFDLMLNNRTDCVVVAINGQRWFEYKHRHDPRTINALEITGAVVLSSVRYEFAE